MRPWPSHASRAYGPPAASVQTHSREGALEARGGQACGGPGPLAGGVTASIPLSLWNTSAEARSGPGAAGTPRRVASRAGGGGEASCHKPQRIAAPPHRCPRRRREQPGGVWRPDARAERMAWIWPRRLEGSTAAAPWSPSGAWGPASSSRRQRCRRGSRWIPRRSPARPGRRYVRLGAARLLVRRGRVLHAEAGDALGDLHHGRLDEGDGLGPAPEVIAEVSGELRGQTLEDTAAPLPERGCIARSGLSQKQGGAAGD